ncbi:hypothetical protein Hanom_Chr00s047125g01777621 [Helianthus anomalus]
MLQLVLAVVGSWWLLGPIMPKLIGFDKRETPYRDENVNTQNIKSFVLSTLTVINFLLFVWLGGNGLGWLTVETLAAVGWEGMWAGIWVLCWYDWAGQFMGWVGDIRGVWVVKPRSYSGSLLVICLSHPLWSIGVNRILFSLPVLYHRLLFRGHLRRLVYCGLSGKKSYPGDIRKDQLGGPSFRCNPICSSTPMLETNVGTRNLLFADNFLVGLGWIEGWDRWLVMSVCWPNDRASCSTGFIGKLGWVMLSTLLLLDLSSRGVFVTKAEKWLHQIGRTWRSKLMLIHSIWPRGICVTKGWVWGSLLHIKLVWMSHSWRGILVICNAVTIRWIHQVCQSWFTCYYYKPGSYIHMRASRRFVKTAEFLGQFTHCWNRLETPVLLLLILFVIRQRLFGKDERWPHHSRMQGRKNCICLLESLRYNVSYKYRADGCVVMFYNGFSRSKGQQGSVECLIKLILFSWWTTLVCVCAWGRLQVEYYWIGSQCLCSRFSIGSAFEIAGLRRKISRWAWLLYFTAKSATHFQAQYTVLIMVMRGVLKCVGSSRLKLLKAHHPGGFEIWKLLLKVQVCGIWLLTGLRSWPDDMHRCS